MRRRLETKDVLVIPALTDGKIVEGVVCEAWTTTDRSIEIYEIILIDDGRHGLPFPWEKYKNNP
jgi:hypothetical protein